MIDSPLSPAPEPGNCTLSPTVAVILPVFNEAQRLEHNLSELLANHPFDEVIVVDGGSTDTSVEIVCKLMSAETSGVQPVPCLIQAPRARARQMHAGAHAAGADVLLFLHADATLPPDAVDRIRNAVLGGYLCGRFDVRLSGRHFLFRAIERLMNWRSRVSGIVTGDQGLFVRRDVYRMLGGFAPIDLMEDIEFSSRLKWVGKPACLRSPVIASTRRWEERGILRTVLSMWTLRFLYRLGISPTRLARWYYSGR
jgi:rSAM/selenodomain-associated transferase 2